ncbi:MAG: HAMP domain-containing protein, partial [Lachnospiraceae bacterium]|nr:HAMP domain-containing protein [Lachnospiraceae bacterium]
MRTFAFSAVVIFSILAAYYVTGHITKPLKQLTAAALKADQGDYDFTLEYKGKDEVG